MMGFVMVVIGKWSKVVVFVLELSFPILCPFWGRDVSRLIGLASLDRPKNVRAETIAVSP